jgi:hypothetical protein
MIFSSVSHERNDNDGATILKHAHARSFGLSFSSKAHVVSPLYSVWSNECFCRLSSSVCVCKTGGARSFLGMTSLTTLPGRQIQVRTNCTMSSRTCSGCAAPLKDYTGTKLHLKRAVAVTASSSSFIRLRHGTLLRLITIHSSIGSPTRKTRRTKN